jgi:uncharacterized iron-regulated membrane protein
MMKAYLLRFHRWIALAFGIPLLAVIATGLILSVEPLVASLAIKPGSVSAAAIESILQRHDPQGRARGIALRPYENTVTLMGVRQGAPLTVDLATGEEARASGMTLSSVFITSRQLHERLLLGNSWLVVASTIAMLVIMAIGIAMGLPKLRNSLSGWHQGTAWLLLPIVVLSPLTGLLLAFGVTLAPAPAVGAPPARVSLTEAVRVVGSDHDLSRLVWIRSLGGRTLARLDEGGELRVFAVSQERLVPEPRHWPRLIHEGTFSALWGSAINALTSFALLGLLGTGVLIWGRRTWRRVARRRARAAPVRSA